MSQQDEEDEIVRMQAATTNTPDYASNNYDMQVP